MTSPVLKAIAARAGVSSPSWESVELILRLMSGGHLRWAYRETVGRPVSAPSLRLRALRLRAAAERSRRVREELEVGRGR